jgi:hypothetical protein
MAVGGECAGRGVQSPRLPEAWRGWARRGVRDRLSGSPGSRVRPGPEHRRYERDPDYGPHRRRARHRRRLSRRHTHDRDLPAGHNGAGRAGGHRPGPHGRRRHRHAGVRPDHTPYGLSLLLAATFAEVPFSRALVKSLPIYVVFFVVISLLIFFPALSLWLPGLMGVY